MGEVRLYMNVKCEAGREDVDLGGVRKTREE